VQREVATDAKWQNTGARDALDELDKRLPSGRRLAAGELQPARRESEELQVCRLALFLAQDSPTPG
jgi:hypothetical protein